MATRLQNLALGFGIDKQDDIVTASTTFMKLKKLNSTITTPNYVTESDAEEIGKANEFVAAVFPSSMNIGNSVEKYASAEWMTYVAAYALGGVTETTGVYTIKPLDHTTTLELPYFSVVEQLSEGGSEAIDNLYVGCSMNDFTYSFNSGPGRASSKLTANWAGSGKITSPSSVSLPATQVEHNMLAAGMTLTVNSVDYVGAKRLVGGSISWNNNLLLNEGFFPGSGFQDTFQKRGRQEIGKRTVGFNFQVRAVSGSSEYTTLKNISSGSAALVITYDSTHTTTFTFAKTFFRAVEIGDVEGLVTFNVTTDPAFDGTNILTITSKCGITGIAQAAA